jgi:hypothetical protein
MDAPLPYTCRSFNYLRKTWASFQSIATTDTHRTPHTTSHTMPHTTPHTPPHTTTTRTTARTTARSTNVTTSSSTVFVETASAPVTHHMNMLNVSSKHEKNRIIVTTTTTTTTITTESSNDFIVEKTLLVDESSTGVSKVYVVVFVVVIAVIGGIVVVWAYIVYKKKKRNVNLPTVAYVRNQPVVIPDRSETPVNTHRSRIAELSHHFLPLNVSTNFSGFGRQEQQQFPEIEIHDIKFMVPDFVPFPGFDIVEFRQILAGVCNRPLFENSSTHCNDPAGVFQFFPETDCLN